MSEQKLMKDQLADQAITQISQALAACLTDFPQQAFIRQALDGLEELELKQRVNHIIVVLAAYLPVDFIQAAEVLIAVKQYWLGLPSVDKWGDFTAWPFIDYVAVYGINEPRLALDVLKILTPVFSAEFAVRAFIELHFDISHQQLMLWTTDADPHIRRLASEGSRSRLPWGKRLSQVCNNPDPIFPILEKLKDDTSLYVRRSVANSLNDIAKDHPEKVINLCQSWSVNASIERQWLIRHALRTLVKSGHQDVFVLLGYSKNPQIIVSQFSLTDTRIVLGDFIGIEVLVKSASLDTQKIVIDYKIHHIKANGLTTTKVFKWKNISLLSQQAMTLNKRHLFKLITTRRYYPGRHTVEILINGVSYGSADFELQIV
jgi:3-methyladenine DNA glycosylase AlkC